MNTNNQIRQLLRRLSSFLAGNGKMWVADYGEAPEYFVAAGNPVGIVSNRALSVSTDSPEAAGPDVYNKHPYELTVSGNSMQPKGISDGDRITCTPVSTDSVANIGQGEFIVIKVDKDFYAARRQTARFAHKLRRVVCNIGDVADFEEMYDTVQRIDDSVLLDHNKSDLKKKFEETREFYGDSEPLMLSTTYKEGSLRYSFHPVRFVEATATKVLPKD
ncbi:MAG: S24 family peptidase [Muribaculaceae bacterium]|nr:S24 family peptidase [Muribaculaceae bacterium]